MNERKWIVVIALLAASCANTQPDETSEQLQPLEQGPVTGSDEDRAEANKFEREEKKKWNEQNSDPTPSAVTPEVVDWDEAAGTKQLPTRWLAAAEASKLAEIELPVLAFDDEKLVGSARISHFKNWYVLAANTEDGLNLNIRGNRNARTAAGMEIPKAAREAATNYTLARTHQVVTVSWRSFGVSYSLDIECSKPMDDTRCTKDDYALAMAESLGVIGGAR